MTLHLSPLAGRGRPLKPVAREGGRVRGRSRESEFSEMPLTGLAATAARHPLPVNGGEGIGTKCGKED